MKTTGYFGLLFLLFFSVVAAKSLASEPAREILGLRLGMTDDQARARLKQIGSFVRNESGNQEIWKVRDSSYANILVGFAKGDKIRYVTAVAREDKDTKRVPYSSIGDLAKAKQAGSPAIKVYNYQWHLPKEKAEPETLVG